MYLITIIILSIVLLTLSIFYFYRINSLKLEKIKFAEKLNANELNRSRLEKQVNSVLSLTHELSDVRNENHIIETLLSLTMDLSNAIGGSFVPLSDKGQPLAAVREGEFPFPIPDAWLEYLASPNVRNKCELCIDRSAQDKSCELMHGPFSDAMGLYCFPLRYGEKELGLLNIYLPGPEKLDRAIQDFINSIAEATAVALEGERLRQREMSTLSQISQVRQKQDVEIIISNVLENLRIAMDAEFVVLVSNTAEDSPLLDQLKSRRILIKGTMPDFAQERIKYIQNRFSADNELRILTDKDIKLPDNLTWLSVPVNYASQSKRGCLILASNKLGKFSERRILLTQSVAEKLSLLIQNSDSLAGIEYKILMEERTRLAREIHDGLAQTLGFLKLQIAQMIGNLDRNEIIRLKNVMRTCYDTLSDAYQDARYAIDSLRITPYSESSLNLKNWLAQTVEGFSELSLDVNIQYDDISIEFPPEKHAQLIRIVQEALSNIRKHARAKTVWIICTQKSNDFILEIRDDGIGFTPEDIPTPSQYGLRGMKERTELLGADFQIESRPSKGTTIRVRIPLEEQDWMEV